jgi:hypothetical protein
MSKHTITAYGTREKCAVSITTNMIPIRGDNVWIKDEHYIVENRNIIYLEDGTTEIDIVVSHYSCVYQNVRQITGVDLD